MNVTHKIHCRIAFFVWAAVGLGLFAAGSFFFFRGAAENSLFFNITGGVLALVIGFVKGNFVLRKVACRNLDRINGLPTHSSIFATFSVKNWLLVLLMIVIGRTIRLFGTPDSMIGVIYLAVGLALGSGSRFYLTVAPQK